MTVPLSLMTIDDPPHTRLTTIDDAPRRSATRPADRTRQADHRTVVRVPVRPTSSTLSTTIASPNHGPAGLSGTPPDQATRAALSQDGDAAQKGEKILARTTSGLTV